jgi:hypothetical protein
MQKVVGSSPISRFVEQPATEHFSRLPSPCCGGPREPFSRLVRNWLAELARTRRSCERREFAEAKTTGREFAEDLRLLEDLGWSETIDRDTQPALRRSCAAGGKR